MEGDVAAGAHDTHTHTQAEAHAYAQAHAYAHAHTNTHTHTHTHTHLEHDLTAGQDVLAAVGLVDLQVCDCVVVA